MMGGRVAFLLMMTLAACSPALPSSTEEHTPSEFTGRFIDVWGIQNIAELSRARVRTGSQIVTEVLVPRSEGDAVDNGVDVAAVAFTVRIECRPVSYDLVQQTNYAGDGRVLSSRGTTGAKFSPRGPYTGLAEELCAGTAPDIVDFTSLAEFREQALTKRGGVIMGRPISVSPVGE